MSCNLRITFSLPFLILLFPASSSPSVTSGIGTKKHPVLLHLDLSAVNRKRGRSSTLKDAKSDILISISSNSKFPESGFCDVCDLLRSLIALFRECIITAEKIMFF